MSHIISTTKEKMNKALEVLAHNFSVMRSGRASPTLLDAVTIVYYGSETPLNQIASISVSEGTQIVVKPYDPSILKDIEKAVFAADLGLTPQNDGTNIRINVPRLTEETRKELVKEASKLGEEAKIVIRNIRRDMNDLIKKDESMPEDDAKKALENIQKTTDDFIKQIDNAIKVKSEEIMTV